MLSFVVVEGVLKRLCIVDVFLWWYRVMNLESLEIILCRFFYNFFFIFGLMLEVFVFLLNVDKDWIIICMIGVVVVMVVGLL